MAESDLIDQYLANLRSRIRGRADVDDVIDEVQDHLRESAATLHAAGIAEPDAQRRTLARFGDPEIIHRVFSVPPSGGVVMPTAFTRTAGAVAVVAAGLWVAAAVLKWWESGLFAPWTQDQFTVYSLVFAAAATASLVVLIGLLARVGWPNPTTTISIGLAAVFTVGALGVAWMWPLTGLFIGTAYLLAIVAVVRTLGRHSWAQWAAAAGWYLGTVALVLLSVLGLGPVDEWGDYPMAAAVGFTVAALGMVIGMLDVARWLLTERASDPVPLALA